LLVCWCESTPPAVEPIKKGPALARWAFAFTLAG